MHARCFRHSKVLLNILDVVGQSSTLNLEVTFKTGKGTVVVVFG